MALTNEDLLAISQLLDVKLKPIKNNLRDINLTLENDVLPKYRIMLHNYLQALSIRCVTD